MPWVPSLTAAWTFSPKAIHSIHSPYPVNDYHFCNKGGAESFLPSVEAAMVDDQRLIAKDHAVVHSLYFEGEIGKDRNDAHEQKHNKDRTYQNHRGVR